MESFANVCKYSLINFRLDLSDIANYKANYQ